LAAELKKVIADPNVDIALPRAGARGVLMERSARESGTDTALYRSLVDSAGKVWPGVPVTPYLFQAGTDASAWRNRGVPVYGIYPYPISDDDLSRMHGNDERVAVDSLDQGTNFVYDTLLRVAAK
jgi:acetylornithine deacetylase/succinyl-diaminopimelate desuccinylase-like protein